MSDETLAAYAQAWQRGDLTAMFALYVPNVTAHYGGRSSFAGTHHGKQRLIEVLAETAVLCDRRLLGVDLVVDTGDAGAIFVRESITVAGEATVVARALRYRLIDGLIVECWLYDHDQHLVDAAWGADAPVHGAAVS